MGFLQELAGRVEDAAQAGGKFADALVRVAGYTIAGTLTFVEREIGYASKAAKKAAAREAPKGRAERGTRKAG